MNRLSERVDCVVVTGAGRGIGAAAAKHLASFGVPVLCISRTQNAHSVRQQIEENGGNAFALSLDLADTVATRKTVSEWISKMPYMKLGIVLAAGTTGMPGGLLDADLTGGCPLVRRK